MLEALRKYLATDHLRVVLSGDLGLYNMLVRREQWQQVTPDFLKSEKSLPEKYQQCDRLGQLIEELQDQYLVKIAPVERRVELRPLNELVDEGKLTFRVGGASVPPREYTRAMARAVVRAALPADQDSFASAILRLPLRSALSILKAGSASFEPASQRDARAGASNAFEAMLRVLSSVLISRDIQPSVLLDPDLRHIMYALSIWLTKHHRWGSVARFTASTGSADYDLVAIVVAAALVRRFPGRPDAMLDFALRICTLREKVERDGLSGAGLLSLTQHLWPTALEGPMRFVSRLAAWDLGPTRPSGTSGETSIRLSGSLVPADRIDKWNPTLRKLYGMAYSDGGSYKVMDRERFAAIMSGKDEPARKRLLETLSPPMRSFHERLSGPDRQSYLLEAGAPHYTLANSLDTLRSGLRSGASAILMLGASRIASGRQRDLGVFSTMRLIATVAELATYRTAHLGSSAVAARVENLLNEAELFRSFPSPEHRETNPTATNAGVEDTDDDAVSGSPPVSETSAGEKRNSFVDLVTEWTSQAPATAVMSPQTISRIWTRFTYAFDGVRAGLREGETKYLGVLTHRTIIAFLHAAGVEALRTTPTQISTLAYRNPVTSAQPFAALLKIIYEAKNDLLEIPEVAFFDHLFACPLWGFFLARRDADVANPTRGDSNNLIFSSYRRRLKARQSAARDVADRETSVTDPIDDRRFGVMYAHPDASGPPAQFAGFYSLLNTVPLQDGRAPLARPNDRLAALVATPRTGKGGAPSPSRKK